MAEKASDFIRERQTAHFETAALRLELLTIMMAIREGAPFPKKAYKSVSVTIPRFIAAMIQLAEAQGVSLEEESIKPFTRRYGDSPDDSLNKPEHLLGPHQIPG